MQWFNQLEVRSKRHLSVAIVFMIVVSSLLAWWILSPTYTILFNHLDEQDANKVINQLEQENIAYRIQNNGHDILIDQGLVDKTRLKVMGSGLQLTNSVGFELFDKNDFGMTDFSQKINYQRALQGELERTIASIDEISQARVHLVIPENHLFSQENNQPKAAITVHLKQALTLKQVRSIQQLVAASVEHLQLKNVIIVDQNGNKLSQSTEDSSLTQLNTKKSIEHYLNDKVSQILQTIFVTDQVLVKINAEINHDELQRERVKPQQQGPLSHIKESKHTTVDKKGKIKGNQDSTLEKTYELGSEKELFKRASGTIERLSVSVILPIDTDAKTLARVQRLVKSAVGFDEKRGDVISIEALIATPMAKQSLAPEIKAPQVVKTQTVLETKWFVFLTLLVLFLSGSTLLIKHRIRQRKRHQLLLELTQCLNHHAERI